MKKILLSTLVALVAIGGAKMSNAQIYNSLDGLRTYFCDGNTSLCDITIVTEPVVEAGTTDPIFRPGELPDTQMSRP